MTSKLPSRNRDWSQHLASAAIGLVLTIAINWLLVPWVPALNTIEARILLAGVLAYVVAWFMTTSERT